ncbi:HEAT repeat domain-containing protein [Roseateles chitinivorans]|uniref:HEAT repeat domain-containing protein n=1 Tax=Roseateles chitinivorans TaxID=2917965 RepID=UPI003D679950
MPDTSSSVTLALADVPITAIVRRHADDAAFYWSQIDGAASSVLLRADAVSGFQAQLGAHLEGLIVAGEEGVKITQGNLERWRKPGEAFVAMLLALEHGNGEWAPAMTSVMRSIRAHPDVVARGAISALAWTSPDKRAAWVRAALAGDNPVDIAIALRAASLVREEVASISMWLKHPDAQVRAAACRATGPGGRGAIGALAQDDSLFVRAECAIAVARLEQSDGRTAAAQLWPCVTDQIAVWTSLTGWPRAQAERRLRRWLKHLAWFTPLGHPGMRALLDRLPRRLALDAILVHGDVAHLPFVIASMSDEREARWAGWTWQAMTGVDIEAQDLALEETEIDLDAPLNAARADGDAGLPLPDVARIAAHGGSSPTPHSGSRRLLGKDVTAQHLRSLLHPGADQPQALRAVAAHALSWMHPDYPLDLRAPARVQGEQLRRMGVVVA